MDEPFITENVAFCGTIGWYDYTFAPKGYDFSKAQYAEKELMGVVWNDKRYAKWSDTDRNVTQRFEVALEAQIACVRDAVSRIMSLHIMSRSESASNTEANYRGTSFEHLWEVNALVTAACGNPLSRTRFLGMSIRLLICNCTMSVLCVHLSVISMKNRQSD